MRLDAFILIFFWLVHSSKHADIILLLDLLISLFFVQFDEIYSHTFLDFYIFIINIDFIKIINIRFLIKSRVFRIRLDHKLAIILKI